MTRQLLGLVIAVVMLTAVPAQAGFIIDAFGGRWVPATAVPPPPDVTIANQDGSLKDTVSWGVPSTTGGLQSSYDFDPRDNGADVNPGQIFQIGVFTHNNFKITSDSPSLAEIDYRIVLNFANTFPNTTVPAEYATRMKFDHWETNNQATPCANKEPNGTGVNANGCADRVLLNIVDKDVLIKQNGVDWYFNLLGFSEDGASFSSAETFWTKEGQSNDIKVYATLTLQPLPDGGATLALLGCALMGLGALRRKFRK